MDNISVSFSVFVLHRLVLNIHSQALTRMCKFINFVEKYFPRTLLKLSGLKAKILCLKAFAEKVLWPDLELGVVTHDLTWLTKNYFL